MVDECGDSPTPCDPSAGAGSSSFADACLPNCDLGADKCSVEQLQKHVPLQARAIADSLNTTESLKNASETSRLGKMMCNSEL